MRELTAPAEGADKKWREPIWLLLPLPKKNFEAEVLHSTKPVLLDFWATWCGPCRMLSPIVDEVAEERTDVKVGKVNVDEQPELASQFGVMSIPTLLVFRDGKLVNQAVGARPKAGVLARAGLKDKNRAVWPLPVFEWAAAFLRLTIWHICHILKGEKCREDFEMGPFVVEFYETRDGQRPAEDFLDELDIKMRSKLVMTLKVLQEQGNRLREPYSKHLDDGIFEIRGKVGTDISRVMYFFYYGGRIILTNGFIKKTQKTPKSEIERAKQYRKDFLEREGESDENTGSVFE